MKRVRHGLSLVMAMGMVVAAATTALAAEGDELAQTIEQSLTGLETQVNIAPENALLNVERQKRQLDTLATTAPDHPMLAKLSERIEDIEERATAAVEAAQESEEELEAPEGEVGPMQAPPELRQRLRKVEGLHSLADRELLRGELEGAKSYLGQAKAEMDRIEDEFADQVPPGYAALIVADERLAALEDMIAAAEPD